MVMMMVTVEDRRNHDCLMLGCEDFGVNRIPRDGSGKLNQSDHFFASLRGDLGQESTG
jgi:hypothetical protein